MSRKTTIRLIVSLLVVAGGAAAAFLATRQRLPSDLRAAVPRASVAIIELRPAALLQTKAFDQLARQRGLDSGMKKVEELCGFNPVAQVDEAMVFGFPVSDDTWPQWGALLRGDLDPRALAECVKDTMASHGQKSALKRATVRGVPCAVSSRGDSRACAVWDGLILGSEAAVDGAIAAMLGEGESVLERPALAEPWQELSADADVRAVGVIPKATRNVLQGFVQPFLPPALAAATRVEGIAGQLFAGGDSLVGEARFDTASVEDAEAVEHTFKLAISRLRDSAAIILSPARVLLQQTQVERDGLRVRVRANYPLHALGTVLDLLPMAARLLGGLADSSADDAAPADAAPKADDPADADGTSKAEPGQPADEPATDGKPRAPAAP